MACWRAPWSPAARAAATHSGGYGQAEFETAGTYRVYEDTADLLPHLGEVGGRGAI